MIDKLLNEIKEIYPVTPCEAPEFDSFRLNLMKYTVKGYDAEGLGRVGPYRFEMYDTDFVKLGYDVRQIVD